MIEIYPDLWIGNEHDYEQQVRNQQGWRVVHACKDPYHRMALGYTGRGAPKDHPEYLFARRGDRLILNLVDAADPAYIPKEIIDAALSFIHESLHNGQRVLVHCNQGASRSAGIGLLYLAAYTDRLTGISFMEAETEFRRIYPLYNPSRGVHGFLTANWEQYRRRLGPA